MKLKILLVSLIIIGFASCHPPTKYQENTFRIGKGNIKEYCHILTEQFSDYTCTGYFNKTYQWSRNGEYLEIKLNSKKLKLIYRCDKDKNDLVLKKFNSTVKQLKELKQ